MRYDVTKGFWTPEANDGNPDFSQLSLTAAGANNLYRVGAGQVLRIIPVADMYIKFSNDAATPTATTTDILLKANTENFISSGLWKFMSASVTTANVIKVKQKG